MFVIVTGEGGKRTGLKLLILRLAKTANSKECSDDRNTLFSLATLHPGFEIDPEYSMSTQEAFILFTRTLVFKGLLELVLDNFKRDAWAWAPEEKERVDSPQCLPGLPSWVLDLQHRDIDDIYADYNPIDATMDESNGLICKLYFAGYVFVDADGGGSVTSRIPAKSQCPVVSHPVGGLLRENEYGVRDGDTYSKPVIPAYMLAISTAQDPLSFVYCKEPRTTVPRASSSSMYVQWTLAKQTIFERDYGSCSLELTHVAQ